MPIKEAEKSYDHKKIENKVQNFWKEEDMFSKVNKLRANGPQYSFLDGPPYCSGKIHLGTAWNKVIKDSYLRFKSMNGFSLRRQAGWDMHGLPIEHKVEQLMGIKIVDEKDRIGRLPINVGVDVPNLVTVIKESTEHMSDEDAQTYAILTGASRY